jgi:hypothetical protein
VKLNTKAKSFADCDNKKVGEDFWGNLKLETKSDDKEDDRMAIRQ